jgi:hypothetical protein
MTRALLLWMACETAVPLPPRVQGPPPPNARMVQAADVTGYLVQPITSPSPLAVLLLVEQLGAASRSEAMNHQGKTVLAIAPSIRLDAASAYLQALPHIQEVRVICRRENCSENSRFRSDPD